MKHLYKASLLSLSILMLSACGGNGMQSENYAATESVSLSEVPIETEFADADKNYVKEPSTQNESLPTVERMLIKDANISFETKNIEETRQQIVDAINKNNGYLSNEDASVYSQQNHYTMTIRIPSTKFETFLSEATKGVRNFDNKNISAKDVTQEFIDVEARLKTRKELESRYLDLLKKASSITDMLEIERQINTLRSEIESVEGRLKYLKNQVSYSTVTISFYTKVPNSSSFAYRFGNSFGEGWDSFISFIIGLVEIWPFLIMITAIVYVGRICWRRSARNKKEKKQPK